MAGPLILYVHDLRGSGVVTNAIALARRLGQERETILVAGYRWGLNKDIDVSPARLVVLSDKQAKLSRLAEAMRLRGFLRSSGATVAASMGNLGHRSFFLATQGLRLKKVYRISNEVGRPGRSLRNVMRTGWKRLFLASGDRLVLVGKALADQPLFEHALADGRAVYIPNGIDLARARQLLKSAKTPAKASGEAMVVTIGRIHPQKNLFRLIEGFSRAAIDRPMRLVIVGGGARDRITKLKSYAVSLGIADRVEFPGETENVFGWLKQADLFALVSRWEGSSTALLEALAAGIPVVASRQAGDAAHVLGGGRFGVLVDADDPQSIAEGIVHQLGPDRILPGDRAEKFDLSDTHDRYAALFTELG
jgi:glycosyltransferase involved in cell wall biosynthesis